MPVFDSYPRIGVNITQVVVHQDIAKPTDLAPGNVGVLSLQCVGYLFRDFRQGLKITQSRVAQHPILAKVALCLYVPDALNGVQNMQGIKLPRFAHSSTTLRITCSRICWFSSCSGMHSTGRLSSWASWSARGMRWADKS